MLKDIKIPLTRNYHSGSNNPPIKLYLDVLPEIKKMDLELGFFSSSAFQVLSYGLAQFIQNGGYMRIITNSHLSLEDSQLITSEIQDKLVNEDIQSYSRDKSKLKKLQMIMSKREQHFYNCLLFLKSEGRLIIQPVQPIHSTNGMAHTKNCVVSDDKNQLYFSGSTNFTGNALLNNIESLDVSPDWVGDIEGNNAKIEEFNDRFEKIINKSHTKYKYLTKSQLIDQIDSRGENKDLLTIFEDELELSSLEFEDDDFCSLFDVLKQKKIEFENKVSKIEKEPRFPYSTGPREYQNKANEEWITNGKMGMFAMATGTGKTITSLNCVLEEYKQINNYRAIIVVPTISLVEQWIEEVYKFNFKNVIAVSSKSDWEGKLSSCILSSKLNKKHSYIIITTYASFHRPKFQSYFKRLQKNTILIADEAHNMGSDKILELLPNIHLNKRIGLSATPKRIYDDLGNIKIQEFFNDKPPFIFEYSMQKAIEKGVLCKYEYFPHIVFLNNIELNEYSKISKTLAKFFDNNTGTYKKDPIVETLLLKRKRIIHKATGKEEIFNNIITKEFNKRGNLNYTLVYVPEGIEPDYSEIEVDRENEEEEKLIDNYTRIVSSINSSIIVNQFTGNTKNRNEILSGFSNGKINVLTSMKCLDEGVDIPRTELAFFCSSTGNPRQFIQRRGRILRTHKDKRNAVIHDLIVVPKLFNNSDTTFDMEKNLVTKELERVVNFAFLAMNKYDAFETLKKVTKHYNISLFEIEEKLKKE